MKPQHQNIKTLNPDLYILSNLRGVLSVLGLAACGGFGSGDSFALSVILYLFAPTGWVRFSDIRGWGIIQEISRAGKFAFL